MNNTMPFLYPNMFLDMNNIKLLENRITNLEKELIDIKNRINKLENKNTNYSNNYQPNSYNMM